jgi:putative transposase
MRCRYRTHLAADMYYASRRTEPPQLIFSESQDYEDFEAFLAQTLDRTGTRLLGYCWMPDAIHLALAIGATPVGEMMQRVTRYCSQRIRRRTGASVNYAHSLPIRLSEPETHLPMLLRYFQCIPVIAGAAESPGAYPYTSHRAYVGAPQDQQLRTTALQTLICVPLLH